MNQAGGTGRGSGVRRGQAARIAGLLIALAALLSACGAQQSAGGAGAGGAPSQKTLRIGYQRGGTLTLLKAQATLEQRLKPLGVSVEWKLFSSGPPLLEAMNTGNVDLGTTGEPPPIFAQAAGTDLVYVASTPPNPHGNAILVPKDSPAQQVADLKGKKVAVAKGSSAHYLLVKALQEAGLSYQDITPVYLAPGDARAAFEGRNVDAWVIWDPFLAVARQEIGARPLRDGQGLIAARGFYLASRSFATGQAELLKLALEEIDKADKWAGQNRSQAAELISPEIGVAVPVLLSTFENRAYGLGPVDDQILKDQQEIADLFFQQKLIPKAIQVREAVLK